MTNIASTKAIVHEVTLNIVEGIKRKKDVITARDEIFSRS